MQYWTRQSHSEFIYGGVASALKNRDYKDFTDIVQEEASDYISATRDPVLQVLWEAYGEKAVSEWGTGMLELVQQKSVLRNGMFKGRLQEQTKDWNELDCYAQICQSKEGKRLLRTLRESRENGCSSHRQQPVEQRSVQSAKAVQELPQFDTQKVREMLDMWETGEGIGLLQQTLHSIQEIWRSDGYKVSKGGGGTSMEQKQRKYVLRRLSPVECARLQGFPDGWCDGADGSDSAQYKLWGNGIALPCAVDVLGRIAEEMRRNAG